MCSEIDPGLEEAITTILWAAPRLCTEVQELKEVRVVVLAEGLVCIFRSRPNKAGLKCPSVRPSIHTKFLRFQ